MKLWANVRSGGICIYIYNKTTYIKPHVSVYMYLTSIYQYLSKNHHEFATQKWPLHRRPSAASRLRSAASRADCTYWVTLNHAMTKWANSEGIHVVFKDFYIILHGYYDGIQRHGGLTGLHGIETWKEATNMGNNDQKRDHQNESKSGFHPAKSWHR